MWRYVLIKYSAIDFIFYKYITAHTVIIKSFAKEIHKNKNQRTT